MQADVYGDLSNFLLAMVGLSVATERVTETVKQWICPTLGTISKARYAATIQTIAIGSGALVTALSGMNPLKIPNAIPFQWLNTADWLSWFVTGLLVSGGSAFWNHLLDILRAAKVQREQAVPAPQTDTTAVTVSVS